MRIAHPRTLGHRRLSPSDLSERPDGGAKQAGPCYIAPASGWRRTQRWLDAAVPWCYVGKDVRLRDAIAKGAPHSTRFPLQERLHDAADRMREPYLRFVAEMGRHQTDRTGWWASNFASKSPFQTDFFLLLCYKAVVLQLVDERKARGGSLVVFVEDPWLFADLAATLAGRADVHCVGSRASTWPTAIKWIVRGVASRALCATYLVVAWIAAAVVWRGRRDLSTPAREPAVGILSFAEARSVGAGRFQDPYLGRLDGLLESHGIPVIRPVFPFFSLSLLGRMAALGGAVWPLVLEFQPRHLGYVLRAWRPEFPEDIAVGPHPAACLLHREILAEFRTSAYNRHLIVKALLRQFLRRGSVSTLAYFFENQPWEKMACLAAAEVGGVRIIAHQHSTVPRFLLTYFLGEGEQAWMPLPQKILTNGSYATGVLRREGRYPAGCIIEAGSWRYEYLSQTPAITARQARTVLVPLPVDASLARLLWTKAADVAPELRARSWRIVVKPHPDVPAHRLGMSARLVQAVELSDAPFARLLENADIVVASGTPVIEAWLRGITAIRLRYESRLDLDPTVEQNGTGMRVADETTLVAAILECVQALESSPHQPGRRAQDLYFSPPRPEVWLREIGRAE